MHIRFDRISVNPEIMNGQPCIRGMRLTVRRVVEAVALYPNRDELKAEYKESVLPGGQGGVQAPLMIFDAKHLL